MNTSWSLTPNTGKEAEARQKAEADRQVGCDGLARVKVPGCDPKSKTHVDLTGGSSRMRPVPRGTGEARWYRDKRTRPYCENSKGFFWLLCGIAGKKHKYKKSKGEKTWEFTKNCRQEGS